MLAYTALMKAVLSESPRVGALGLNALPLLVYLQRQTHTLSACAPATRKERKRQSLSASIQREAQHNTGLLSINNTASLPDCSGGCSRNRLAAAGKAADRTQTLQKGYSPRLVITDCLQMIDCKCDVTQGNPNVT